MKKRICILSWLVWLTSGYGGTDFRVVAQRSEAAPGGGTYRDVDLSFSENPASGFSSDGQVGLIAQTLDALGMAFQRWDPFAGAETGLVVLARQFTQPPGMPAGSTIRWTICRGMCGRSWAFPN